jgi:hypothetical protein
MKTFLYGAVILSVVAILSACTSAPAVQRAEGGRSAFADAVYSGTTVELDTPTPGAERFRIFQQGATGFVHLASVRRKLEQRADKHCERRGKAVHALEETTANPPFILGNFPRVEWVFECIDYSSVQASAPASGDKYERLERLKSLLDNGTITQQEFDSEKSKILSSP